MKKFKPFLRWIVLTAVLVFLGKTLWENWAQVAAVRVSASGWGWMAIALFTTLFAHAWGGWVWGWILQFLNQPISNLWSVHVYFQTNLAKYIPGNVWHFVGRVTAAQKLNVPLEIATLSVLLEPLLMAAAAALLTLVSVSQANPVLQWGSLAIVLIGVHPWFLNQGLAIVDRLKHSAPPPQKDLLPPAPLPSGYSPSFSNSPSAHSPSRPPIQRYPLLPLLGELGFLLLRGAGFVAIAAALQPLQPNQILPLLGSFSLAWLTGLVVPGAPGGLGVFEATAITLLRSQFTPGVLITVVALYRLVSTLAEAIGAVLASCKPVK